MRKRRIPIGFIFLCLMCIVTGFGAYQFLSSVKKPVYVATEHIVPQGKTIQQLIEEEKLVKNYVRFDETNTPDGLIDLSEAGVEELVLARYLTKEILKGYPLSVPMIDETLRVDVPDGFELIRVGLNPNGYLSHRLTANEQVSLYYQEQPQTTNGDEKPKWLLYAKGLRLMGVTKSPEGAVIAGEFLIPVSKISSFIEVLNQPSGFVINAKKDVDICYRNQKGEIDPVNGLWCATEHPTIADIKHHTTGQSHTAPTEVNAPTEPITIPVIWDVLRPEQPKSFVEPTSTATPKPVIKTPKSTSVPTMTQQTIRVEVK